MVGEEIRGKGGVGKESGGRGHLEKKLGKKEKKEVQEIDTSREKKRLK